MKWNAQRYEKQHDFVFKYGEGLLTLLPQTAHTVLDVGCGTGDLTDQIRQKGFDVLGIDQSVSMVEEAKRLYPLTEFQHQDILTATSSATYDVVFSNAVFHWINDQDRLLDQIHKLLNPGGYLICEFGGHNNVAAICNAFGQELEYLGFNYQNPFFFPETTAYKQLLIEHGFQVLDITDYDRPTVLHDGIDGLANWIKQFFQADLARLNERQQATVLKNMTVKLRGQLWRGDHWEADYRRLRVVARV